MRNVRCGRGFKKGSGETTTVIWMRDEKRVVKDDAGPAGGNGVV